MNRSTILSFFLGVVLSGTLVWFIKPEKECLVQLNYPLTPTRPTPIKLPEAQTLFSNYHNSVDYANSGGLLRIDDGSAKALVGFYVEWDNVIRPLRDSVPSWQSNFKGVFLMPAYNKFNESHTFIAAAVVKNGNGVRIRLPESTNSEDLGYFIDHVNCCPPACGEDELNRVYNLLQKH